MKTLLECTPDIDKYLIKLGINDEYLEMLGINKYKHLKTLKDLTDLAAVLKALKGDTKNKVYIDEQFKEETQSEALNTL